MNGGILVVGSLNMDESIQVKEMPVQGETILGKSLVFTPGGKGANQACAAGKLGGQVAMLGCVGDDDFGRAQKEQLSGVGVEIAALKTSQTQPTGTAIILVNQAGNNCIVVASGANMDCDAAYLQENDDLLQQCDYVLLQMEIPYEAIFYTIRRAAELGKKVVLNPAPAPDTLPEDIWKKLTYLTPNETELSKLTGMPVDTPQQLRAAALRLLRRGVQNVLVTIGKQGVLLVNQAGAVLYPTTDKKPIDTTAAGDTFNAAFLVGLSEGKSEEEAIRFGNMASSITVTRKGAQASIPTRAETEAELENFHPVSKQIESADDEHTGS